MANPTPIIQQAIQFTQPNQPAASQDRTPQIGYADLNSQAAFHDTQGSYEANRQALAQINPQVGTIPVGTQVQVVSALPVAGAATVGQMYYAALAGTGTDHLYIGIQTATGYSFQQIV
jgi:hypothetical protein